jgi:hypothetical protein
MKHQVDLFIVGHVHAYERQWPIYRNSIYGHQTDMHRIVNAGAPIYIVTGAAGCVEGERSFACAVQSNTARVSRFRSGLSNPNNTNWVPAPWTATRYGDDYGFSMLHVLNSTALYWEFFRSGDGGLQDYFYLIKDSSEREAV